MKFLRAIVLFLVVQAAVAADASRNEVRFNATNQTVSVQSTGWGLEDCLAHLAAATEWEIYVEPDATHSVTARFRDLAVGEALSRILGSLNYALLPRAGAPPKLFVFSTTAQDATRRIAPAQSSARRTDKRVPNELLVLLKPGANADQLARQLGAKVAGRIDASRAFRLRFDDEDAVASARDALANNNLVATVDDNYFMEKPDTAQPLAASSPLPFSLKPTAGDTGGQLIVGLVDTAVQPTGAAYDGFLLPAISVEADARPSAGAPSHGTSMAETILRGLALASEDSGSSSGVRILPVDVYGGNPSTTTFDVAWGISKAVQGGAKIINLSLGSSGTSRILETLIQNVSADGVVLFAAAGNEPTSAATFPAAYPEVVAVTAGDKRGNLAPYANYGSFVDVVGPGASMVYYNNRSFLVNGTSSATAFMSGMAAGLAYTTQKTPQQIEPRIRTTFRFRGPSR